MKLEEVVGSEARGYPCPKDGDRLVILEDKAYCLTCWTWWWVVEKGDAQGPPPK